MAEEKLKSGPFASPSFRPGFCNEDQINDATCPSLFENGDSSFSHVSFKTDPVSLSWFPGECAPLGERPLPNK